MSNLKEICLKYGLIHNVSLCKELGLILKDNNIVALIKVHEIKGYDNEISFYDLEFFKNKKLITIKKVSKKEDIEKIIFDLVLNNKTRKLTKTFSDTLSSFEKKIDFSYNMTAERIKDEIIKKIFKLNFVSKTIDKDNKKIIFSIYKNKKILGLKITFNVEALFDDNKIFLSNIEILDKDNSFKKQVMVLLDSIILINNFVQVYLERKDKFKLDKIID